MGSVVRYTYRGLARSLITSLSFSFLFKALKSRHTVAVINLPRHLESLKEEDEKDMHQQPVPKPTPLLSTAMPVHIFESDPARLELAKAQEATRKRQAAETLLALEKIQKRIDYAIAEYEGTKLSKEVDTNVNLDVVEDPNRLFDLLTDPKVRSKYHQKLSVFILGYEEKQEELEGVLGQLQDFFMENQGRGTEELVERAEEEELELDEATKVLGGALATAQNSVEKLVKIKKELTHLVAIVSAYPDTNKGRKKMEKALLKAQENVATLSKNLEDVQGSLKESCSQLQVQLDVKTEECTKLRKTVDEVKLLKVGNDKLKRELGDAEKALKESQKELSEVKSQLKTQTQTQQPEESQLDKKKMAELEEELKQEREKYHKLVAEMENLSQAHQSEMEVLKAEHEAESSELRGRFEDQLKSLMEEDVFGEDGVTEEPMEVL